MATIFCCFCKKRQPRDNFSAVSRRQYSLYLRSINDDEPPELYCLDHTTSSGNGDRVPPKEKVDSTTYKSSESDEENASDEDDDGDDREYSEELALRKRSSHDIQHSKYVALGEEWAKMHNDLVMTYAYYTKRQMIDYLVKMDYPSDGMHDARRREDYLGEFIDTLITRSYDRKNSIKVAPIPVDLTLDLEPGEYLLDSDDDDDAQPQRNVKRNRDSVVILHAFGTSKRKRSIIGRYNNCDLALREDIDGEN